MEPVKCVLRDDEIPRQWYNIQADLPHPLKPPLHPATGRPISPEDLAQIFPMNLIEQEVSQERWIAIPDQVLEKYLLWRPTPLMRARNFEKALDCPVRIYFKHEGMSPPGSHKPNTAVAQAYYNKAFGIKRLSTETGAGQWGSALAFACQLFGLECRVFMVKVSYEQKPYRRLMMNTWGATCMPSPTTLTEAGRKILTDHPDSPGSLGIAISEAVEDAVRDPEARYSLGSVLNHVLLHQTIIGLETKKQMEKMGEYPDVIIACAGGGSNFAGMAMPYVLDKINGKNLEIIATEPTSCPTLTRGLFAYDFGDAVRSTPLLLMYTLGHNFVPAPIHAGGLRYHGIAPIVSQCVVDNLVKPRAYVQNDIFAAGILFARTEGHIPAPETDHAIAAVVEEARKAKEEGKEKVILFNFSGHGLMDLPAYDAYLNGRLTNHELSDEEIERALKAIENLPKP